MRADEVRNRRLLRNLDWSSPGRVIVEALIRWRTAIAIFGLMLGSVMVAAALFAPTVTGRIGLQSVRYDGGFLYVAPIPATRGRFYRLSSDWISRTGESKLRLFDDGKPLGPAHSAHDEVRQLGAGRYVHWGTELWFSTRDGTDPRENGRSYTFVSKLSLKPLWSIVGLTSFALAVVAMTVSLTRRNGHLMALAHTRRLAASLVRRSGLVLRRCTKLLMRTPIVVMRTIGYLLLLAAGIYLVAVIHALLMGWALPTAAPIQRTLLATRAAEWEPLFHLSLLSLATLGAVASWFNQLAFRNALELRRDELLLARFIRRWGIFLTVALSVFSVSAIWAGVPRAGDLNWGSIAGLIPFSDANGYLAATHDQAKDGSWSIFALRRPLAAAFRSSLMFVAGFSYAGAVLLQIILLASAAYAAGRAVAAWRGIYAGLAFFALSYVTMRTFLPTFLTEPLGLFWALLAIPFLVKSLRDGSLKNGLLGLAMITVGLFMRPGAMFVIAALGFWLVWRFGNNLRERLRTAAYAAAIVLLLASASHLLHRTYGVDSNVAGSNFSYTLCGLSIGTDWSGCINRYEEVKKLASEKRVTDFMYQKALENIAAQPEVIVGRLYSSASSFARELPAVLWRGYSWWGSDYSNLRQAFLVFAAIGLIYVAVRRREKGEFAFWLLIWASVIASAAFVHFDDGRRVMVASYPLLWMFVASGLAITPVPTSRTPPSRVPLYGGVGVLCAGVLFFVLPWLAHQLSPAADLRSTLVMPTAPNEHVVFGGRRVTGMLVVADDQPLRTDIPTLHLSRFAEFIKLSNVEFYQGLLDPQTPKVPFGFIWAPRLESGVHSDFQYIVPAEVMQRTDVKVWKFQVREWNRKEPYGSYWFFVDKAEAIR